MKRDLNIAHVMQKLAFCMSGILVAFAPSYAFAERPEVDCAGILNDDSLSTKFFDLSGQSAQAAQEKNYDEALAYALKAMEMCTTDYYTEYTLARIYQLTEDCPNAYYHYEILMNRSDQVLKENADYYKEVKKHFKKIKEKCGDVVTLEITCATPDMSLATTNMGDIANLKCPFYGKVKPGSYSFMGTKEGYQAHTETVNVAEGTGAVVKFPALKEAQKNGKIRVTCPRGASKFEIQAPDGTRTEYLCPWEGELPEGSYKVKLGGGDDSEFATVLVSKNETTTHSIPNIAKSNCASAPLSGSTAPIAGGLMVLLAGLGLAIRRRRED